MKNFISKHATQTAYTAAQSSFDKPHVAFIEELAAVGGITYINKPAAHNYANDYFTLVALSSGTFTFDITISYSTDNGDTWTSGKSVNVSTDDRVLLKRTIVLGYSEYSNNGDPEQFDILHIQSSNQLTFNVEGNIMSLMYGDNFVGQTSFIGTIASYHFSYLFRENNGLISAENLILPATTLSEGCYDSMFSGCTSLTTAPELPATTLAQYCYNCMFDSCTSLTTAPELPATTLANACYNSMFYGCTSLTTAPELPATTLAQSCYQYMFEGCTSLTTAPELPATTLADYCYTGMFYGCTSLTTAPELPATTLSEGCYDSMFSGCTSLTTAPVLPATTLTEGCYIEMFYNCTALLSEPEIPSSINYISYTYCNEMYWGTNLQYDSSKQWASEAYNNNDVAEE